MTDKTKEKPVYTESGWIAEVEVLEDKSDIGKLSYTLKVVKTLAEGRFGSLPEGHVFAVSADRRHMVYCDWRLNRTG